VLLALLPVAGTRRWWARPLETPLVLWVALSVSLIGHAADWGDVSAPVGLDCIHVVAATAWTGGLFVLGGLLLREAAGWRAPLLADLMQRFSRLAGWCLLAVVLSGAYAVVTEVPTPAALWQTAYGRALAVKLLLVLLLAGGGAVNRYVVLPRLGVGRIDGLPARLFRGGWAALLGPARALSSSSPSHLPVYLAREAALALVIFACTAVLVESTPSRHARHLEHGAATSGLPRDGSAGAHHAGHHPVGDAPPSPGARLSW